MRLELIFAAFVCGLCWGQTANDCRPSSLNIPGAPYPCIYPDHRVAFRVAAPDAQKVQVRLGGVHDMTRGRTLDSDDTTTGRRVPLLQHRRGWCSPSRSRHQNVLRVWAG